MQLLNGSVLSQMHVDGFAANSPPSADTNVRYYQNPTLESGAVFAGTLAFASRVFAAEGQTAYATTLKNAALAAWTWLQTQGSSEEKVWAAAEIFRTDPTATSAKSFVDVTGGPNKDYSGDAFPPLGAVYYNRFYRDWSDQVVWTARTWEITESSIGYQGAYVALGAYFLPAAIFTDGFESGNTTAWSAKVP